MPPVVHSQYNAKKWGAWFTPLGDGNVKQTNLAIFYHLGKSIKSIDNLEPGTAPSQAMFLLFDACGWLINFIEEMRDIDVPDTLKAAQNLIDGMNAIGDMGTFQTGREDVPVTTKEVWLITGRKDWFEKCFDRESRYLDVFTVTPKGIYNTRALMTRPEEKFSERIRAALGAQMVADLKQAGRCLAFDIPTACAFHICRATESLMLTYYETLSGGPWPFPRRDWKNYIDQLASKGAPKRITDRLDEIRDTDRNAYAHPDLNVTLEEAPILFELCTGVIFQMASEIDKKLNP
jgi:Domain of unknown function (DUF4145)